MTALVALHYIFVTAGVGLVSLGLFLAGVARQEWRHGRRQSAVAFVGFATAATAAGILLALNA